MQQHYKSRLGLGLLGLFIIGSIAFSPLSAVAGNYDELRNLPPAVKTALLQSLLAQLQILQAQLVALQQAETKGPNVANAGLFKEISMSLSQLRPGAEIEYTHNGGYGGLCETTAVATANKMIVGKGGQFTCVANANHYVIAANLTPMAKAYCVDSTGWSGEMSSSDYETVTENMACVDDGITVAIVAEDYTRGSSQADVNIVTYTDLECPFCKMFHETLDSVQQTYPDDVAVTYRHFPLVALHPNAKELAIAAECVGMLGGDSAFWKFTDLLFASRATNAQTNMSKVPAWAATVGVASRELSSCRSGATARAAVEADLAAGIRAGVQGTPMSFVIYGDEIEEISGAQPLSNVEQLIAELLAK